MVQVDHLIEETLIAIDHHSVVECDEVVADHLRAVGAVLRSEVLQVRSGLVEVALHHVQVWRGHLPICGILTECPRELSERHRGVILLDMVYYPEKPGMTILYH